jgi:hypothetical protein
VQHHENTTVYQVTCGRSKFDPRFICCVLPGLGARRILVRQGGNMHLRNLTTSLRPSFSVSLVLPLLIIPLVGFAQNPGPFPQRSEVMSCPAQNRECSSPGAFYPGNISPAPTLESVWREAAVAQWQNAQQQEDQPIRRRTVMQSDGRPPRATPEAPDQSDRLKNSKDPDFILRNFRTMYVETRNIDFFRADQMKAALRSNPDFSKLHINIVEDRSVADVVLTISYTFAWDYPFVLRHQNTTLVLLAGKGEGPFSGPLGAADVARVFVNLAEPWRSEPAKNK